MSVTDKMHAYIRGINGISMAVKSELLRMANLGSMWQIDRILDMQGSAWHESNPTASVKSEIHKIWNTQTN